MKKYFICVFLFLLVDTAQSQISGVMELDCTDGAHFMLFDTLGRKTGCDPRGKTGLKAMMFIKEIPESNYSYDGPPADIDNPNDKPPIIHSLLLNFPDNANTSKYRAIFYGAKTSLYSVVLNIGRYGPVSKDSRNIRFKGVIEKDSIANYTLVYNSQLNTPIIFKKEVTPKSLVQDVSAMLKLGWIQNQTVSQDYVNLFSTANTQLQSNNFTGARATLNNIIVKLQSDSAIAISGDAFNLLNADTRQLLAEMPLPSTGYNVKLINSAGTKLTGGALQYYDGAWKDDALNNNDGTFFINTTKKTLSIRMTYEYTTQTKSNVPLSNDTVTFQTVNSQIQLQNSQGILIDTGTVQYYAGAWRSFGTTINGAAAKELLPGNYSFRISYAYASKDKQQDIGANPTVVFQTVNSSIQLQNSSGTLIDTGSVQYYSGAWRSLGTTINGIATKELLPNNYSFRMTYAYASKDKQQDIGVNQTVVFQTINAVVQLQTSQGALIDQGAVQYYSGSWREFGATSNGIATKELLPNDYSFRMTYAYASKDKQQDLNTNATVVFQTVPVTVELRNSQNSLFGTGTVQYYSGAWRDFGTITNGIIVNELLSNTYSFRMIHEYISLDKKQDIATNSNVAFTTTLCTIRAISSTGQMLNGATASYYSGAWRVIGNTVNGIITKELLPVNLAFRIKYGTTQKDKQQNLSTDSVVEFVIP